MKALLLPAIMFTMVSVNGLASDDIPTNAPATTVLPRGSYETVQAKVLKVFAVEDNGAIFRAYQVKWKDSDVIVSDMLARSNKKEGDTITFTVNRMELASRGNQTNVLSFMILPTADRVLPFQPSGQRTNRLNFGATKYVGEWQDGQYGGQGTLTYPDGRQYIGQFKNGQMEGQGEMTYPDGKVQNGLWKDGKFTGASAGP